MTKRKIALQRNPTKRKLVLRRNPTALVKTKKPKANPELIQALEVLHPTRHPARRQEPIQPLVPPGSPGSKVPPEFVARGMETVEEMKQACAACLDFIAAYADFVRRTEPYATNTIADLEAIEWCLPLEDQLDDLEASTKRACTEASNAGS